MNQYKALIAIVLFLCLGGCDNDQTIRAYVVAKYPAGEVDTDTWQPLMEVKYRVEENKVISELAGLLDEYNDCAIQNKKNWQCKYTDDRGNNTFGFKNGKFWKYPTWGENIKYVSRWEYNMIRCKWYFHRQGSLKDSFLCLLDLQ